jgi:hypothetical protein
MLEAGSIRQRLEQRLKNPDDDTPGDEEED